MAQSRCRTLPRFVGSGEVVFLNVVVLLMCHFLVKGRESFCIMPPIPKMEEECGPIHVQIPLLDMASAELEKMRLDDDANKLHNFPPACMTLLKSLDGNNRCIDCGEHGPQWAALSYGALLCLQCSGKHRSLGVQVGLA